MEKYYIEYKNGFVLNNLSELELYKTLYLGYFDENGYELEVECYGKIL